MMLYCTHASCQNATPSMGNNNYQISSTFDSWTVDRGPWTQNLEGLSCKLASSIKSSPRVRIGPTISISVCARISSSRRCFSCRRWATSLLLNPWVVTAVATISPPTFASTGRWAWWGGTPGAHSHAQGRAPLAAACQMQLEWLPLTIFFSLEMQDQGNATVDNGLNLVSIEKSCDQFQRYQDRNNLIIPKKTCRIKRILVTNLKPLRNRPKSSSTSPV